MAEIQIVYRYYYCEVMGCEDKACRWCHTDCAMDVGCRCYSDGGIQYDKKGVRIISDRDCVHAQWKYAYKGWVGKRYEMEEYKDEHEPFWNYMYVKLGNKEYDCVKVTLNGECIYNKDDETSESS